MIMIAGVDSYGRLSLFNYLIARSGGACLPLKASFHKANCHMVASMKVLRLTTTTTSNFGVLLMEGKSIDTGCVYVFFCMFFFFLIDFSILSLSLSLSLSLTYQFSFDNHKQIQSKHS